MTEESHRDKTNIASRFSVLNTLGEGGMGAVYLAHDQVLNRQVAVKMLRIRDATDETYMRFQKEAKAIAKLKHGAIMTALDFGVTDGGEPYLVLDYITGATLQAVLDQRTRLEIDEAITVAIRVCEGLEYAHGQGVVHRDIKPSNIYLVNSETFRDSIRILDFGLARLAIDDQRHTTAGAVMGSPPYMSPEQSRGEEVDERCDVYSLGCVLFQMLTGAPPLAGETALETITMKLTEDPPSMKEVADSLKDSAGSSREMADSDEYPMELERIVARCLSRDIGGRYKNISVLLADLSEFKQKRIEDYTIPDEDADTASGGNKTKTSTVGIVLATAGVVIVSGVATAFYLTQQAEDAQSVRSARTEKLTKKAMGGKLSDREGKSVDPSIDSLPGFLKVTAKECVFTGLPKSEDVAQLASSMRGRTTCVFDTVEGKLDGKELRPLEETGITNLRISVATLTTPALEVMRRLKHLKDLILNGCEFESAVFKNPKDFHLIKNLTISGSALQPDDIRNIPLLESLVNLDLSNNRGITPEFLGSLKRLKRLETLALGGRAIGLAHLNSLNALRVFRLELNDLDGVTMADAFRAIKGMPSLTSLYFNDNNMNSDDVAALCKLENLEELRFLKIRGLHREDWLAIAKLPKLVTVELENIDFDRSEDILAFVYSKSLKTLRTIDMPEVDANIYSQLRSKIPEVIVQ